MKTGRSRKYYLMEAVLILFNILINLIIFAVPLAVNQIINGKLALTDRVIAFIIGFMLLEICIQFVYLLIELHMQKEYKKNLSKEIYQKIYSMVEQLALDEDVQTILTTTKVGQKMTENEVYPAVLKKLVAVAGLDTENIQGVFTADLDSNASITSAGGISGDDYDCTTRTW